MNRTVRCLAIFAIGVGAWACKGDPQGSLNRGDISRVNASPARVFVDNGSTVEVLIDARDQLNEAVEITGVSEAVGAGITLVRDFLYQPVFDAGATDETSCGQIEHSEWTGAGCLVPRTNPTRLRYQVTGNMVGAISSFTVTVNGSNSVDVPVTVTPASLTGALSNLTPASGEDVVLTLPATLTFDPAVVADPTMWQVVSIGGTAAVVSDLQAQTATFQFQPNVAGPVDASDVAVAGNPSIPTTIVTTTEDLTSPIYVAPYPITLSPGGTITGFDVVTVTAGGGLIFAQNSELFVAPSGTDCAVDPACAPATINSRAPDGSSMDVLFPQNNMGAVYVTAMAAAAAPQFATLDGESDQSITISATTVSVNVSQGLPAAGVGLEVVRLTLADPGFTFSSTAAVTAVDNSGTPVGFYPVGVDPGGTWVEYVPAGGSSGIPTVSGIQFNGLQFEFPANAGVTVPASTFGATTNQAGAPDITGLMPASGSSVTYYDTGDFGGDVFGADRLYNITGPQDFTLLLDWSNGADIDILYADNPATAGFVCGGGATGAQPETSNCQLGAGGWTLALNLYAGSPPAVLAVNITGN